MKITCVRSHFLWTEEKCWFVSVGRLLRRKSLALCFQTFRNCFPSSKRKFGSFSFELRRHLKCRDGHYKIEWISMPRNWYVFYLPNSLLSVPLKNLIRAGERDFRNQIQDVWKSRFLQIGTTTRSLEKFKILNWILSFECNHSKGTRRTLLRSKNGITFPKIPNVSGFYKTLKDEVSQNALLGSLLQETNAIVDNLGIFIYVHLIFLVDVIWSIAGSRCSDFLRNNGNIHELNNEPIKLYLLVWGDGSTPARKSYFFHKIRLLDPSQMLFSNFLSGNSLI